MIRACSRHRATSASTLEGRVDAFWHEHAEERLALVLGRDVVEMVRGDAAGRGRPGSRLVEAVAVARGVGDHDAPVALGTATGIIRRAGARRREPLGKGWQLTVFVSQRR
jgi:hypothetical protein